MGRLTTLRGYDRRPNDFTVVGRLSVGNAEMVRVFERGERPTDEHNIATDYLVGDLWVFHQPALTGTEFGWTEIFRARAGGRVGDPDQLIWELVSQRPIFRASFPPTTGGANTPLALFQLGRRWHDTTENQYWVRIDETGRPAEDWLLEGEGAKAALQVRDTISVGSEVVLADDAGNQRAITPIYRSADEPTANDDEASDYQVGDLRDDTTRNRLFKAVNVDEGQAQWRTLQQPPVLIWQYPHSVGTRLSAQNTFAVNHNTFQTGRIGELGRRTIHRLTIRTGSITISGLDWDDYAYLILRGSEINTGTSFGTLNAGLAPTSSNTAIVATSIWNSNRTQDTGVYVNEVVLGDLQHRSKSAIGISRDQRNSFRYRGISSTTSDNPAEHTMILHSIHGIY